MVQMVFVHGVTVRKGGDYDTHLADRDAARTWFNDLAERESGPAPNPDDVPPEGCHRPR